MRWIPIMFALAACGGHGSSNAGLCAELSLHDCRLTDGCKPDLCDTCICDVAYRGCLSVGATPAECPQLGCPSGQCCTEENDCDSSAPCVKPGTPLGCGICTTDPGDCTTDGNCSAGKICEPITCSCDGNKMCVDGCTSESCGEGTVCDSGNTNRCIAQPCGAGGPDCPENFTCTGTSCARIQCTDDLDCDGFCVLGECFGGARGECRPPAA